jgi:hypothetical protein
MKQYPSIPRSTGQSFQEFDAWVFDKLDGSNLRFEWSKKQKWHKFGTRTQLFDSTHQIFGHAIPIFESYLASPLEKLAVDNKWERLVCFAEYWSPNSFAGWHAEEEHSLTVIDLAPHKKGILGPKEFVKLTEKTDIFTAPFLGNYKWTRGFVERVYKEEIPGISCEGVIGKAGSDNKLIMAKAKTKTWLDKVKEKFTEEEAEKIINS